MAARTKRLHKLQVGLFRIFGGGGKSGWDFHLYRVSWSSTFSVCFRVKIRRSGGFNVGEVYFQIVVLNYHEKEDCSNYQEGN